jgi:MinD-like ATPase involved in chromosome partitioning or flagellar assembly
MVAAATGKKILIVDTDVASRNFIARTLQQQQHEVIQVSSAKEGLIAAWRDQPDLIIIEPVMEDLKGEEFAVRLRQDPRTARLPLIALSADKTPARQKACLDAGFNEYILKSGQAISRLMDSINGLLGLKVAGAGEGGLSIVFLSAKGGIGTSSLCVNVAMNIAQAQPEAKVAVVDMVLPIGSLAHIVGFEEENRNLVTVAGMSAGETDGNYFRENLPRLQTWQFHLLAGSPDPESANELQGNRIGDIIRALKSGFDYVIVDLGRSLSKFSIPLIKSADLLALIVSSDASTVTLTRTLLDYLRAQRVDNATIYPILNRAVGLEGLTKAEIEKELGLEIKTAVPYLGGNFTMANNQHRPFSQKFPGDTTSIIFVDLARKIMELARKRRAEAE